MANAKASDVLAVLRLVRERGPEAERSFLARLSPGTTERVRLWVPTEWIPLTEQTEVLRSAADALYPEDTHGLRHLGEAAARPLFTGTYRAFLKTPTPQFFFKRFPTVWRALYDQGTALVETSSPHQAGLLVRAFPELTPTPREYLCGLWAGVLKLTEATTVTVIHEDHFPMEWRWDLRFA
jgi:hypothetical protein